jgi:hypothetical protein
VAAKSKPTNASIKRQTSTKNRDFVKEAKRKSDTDWDLFVAARDGDVKAVTRLIARGADVNVRDSLTIPVLIWAAKDGHTDIVELLLANGADVNVRSGDQTDRFTALMWAAEAGQTDTMRVLIASGANIDDRNDNGCTALIRAAKEDKTEAVRLLLANGADVNAVSEGGETALTISKSPEVKALLSGSSCSPPSSNTVADQRPRGHGTKKKRATPTKPVKVETVKTKKEPKKKAPLKKPAKVLISSRQIRSNIEQNLPIRIGEVGVEKTRVRMTFCKYRGDLTDGEIQSVIRFLKNTFPVAEVSVYCSSADSGDITIEFHEDIKER